jgi:hypothetical protein
LGSESAQSTDFPFDVRLNPDALKAAALLGIAAFKKKLHHAGFVAEAFNRL